MSRLPVPGGDDGDWGSILNDFLSQSIDPDGTLKPSSVAAASPVTSVANKTGAVTLSVTGTLPTFSKVSTLTVGSGTLRLPVDTAYTITGVRLTVGTAPTGASLICDVLKNGTTIFTTSANRPTIAAGSNAGGPGATPDVTALSPGDYLTVNIDQVGSTIAGSDLVLSVIVTQSVS